MPLDSLATFLQRKRIPIGFLERRWFATDETSFPTIGLCGAGAKALEAAERPAAFRSKDLRQFGRWARTSKAPTTGSFRANSTIAQRCSARKSCGKISAVNQ